MQKSIIQSDLNFSSSQKEQFYIPEKNGKEVIYFCGNSLGLQPKAVSKYISEELEAWAKMGVGGHFKATNSWVSYHKIVNNGLANLVGCKSQEVVAMNALTVNLHLLLVSFYRPTKIKFKILIESGAFPSDQYALHSQIKFHGFDPTEAIIEVLPRAGEYEIRNGDVLEMIELHKNELTLVMLSGINYYTGQLFNIKEIALKAQQVNCLFGLDLAHAIGNVPMQLHNWGVDFATWCSYKYLNAGPGGVSGVFIHEKHFDDVAMPRFEGWWGHDENTRFKMDRTFVPMYGAEAWQLSNPPILCLAILKASLDIFESVGIENLRQKSILMTQKIMDGLSKFPDIKIITPKNPDERGCQISMLCENGGLALYQYLHTKNIVIDWREPNVIRIAPVPMYNTFEEIDTFLIVLAEYFNGAKFY